jgi:hypothetical protein
VNYPLTNIKPSVNWLTAFFGDSNLTPLYRLTPSDLQLIIVPVRKTFLFLYTAKTFSQLVRFRFCGDHAPIYNYLTTIYWNIQHHRVANNEVTFDIKNVDRDPSLHLGSVGKLCIWIAKRKLVRIKWLGFVLISITLKAMTSPVSSITCMATTVLS